MLHADLFPDDEVAVSCFPRPKLARPDADSRARHAVLAKFPAAAPNAAGKRTTPRAAADRSVLGPYALDLHACYDGTQSARDASSARVRAQRMPGTLQNSAKWLAPRLLIDPRAASAEPPSPPKRARALALSAAFPKPDARARWPNRCPWPELRERQTDRLPNSMWHALHRSSSGQARLYSRMDGSVMHPGALSPQSHTLT